MPLGSPPDVPCAVCHERIPGLAWGDRCPSCKAIRLRRARRLARRSSLVAAIAAALILRFTLAPGPDARMVLALGTLGVFFTVRVIVQRVAMEFLPD